MIADMSVAKHTGHVLPVITDVIPGETPEITKLSEIELGLLQTQILWLLSRKSAHGYELMKTLTVLRGARMTQGTLYPTMQRLEELGLAEREALHDRKIIYHVTDKGKQVMNETCLAFVKTFYGIFHDYACERCDHYKAFSFQKRKPLGNLQNPKNSEMPKKQSFSEQENE